LLSKSPIVSVCLYPIHAGYVGIFYAFAVMGPVVAFVCGGFLLRLYTHFDVVDSSQSVQLCTSQDQ